MSKKKPEAPLAAQKIMTEMGFDESRYEINEKYEKTDSPHTMQELAELIESDPKCKVDVLVLCANSKGDLAPKRIQDRTEFLEAWKKGGQGANLREARKNLREGFDSFGSDSSLTPGANGTGGSPFVGDDYVPIMGGPFNKQLYIYDALRMYALTFQAYHHDPMARAIVNITRDFTLGRGYRVDSKDKDALAIWRAFEEVNDLQRWFSVASVQLALDGELMIWWLPGNATAVRYKPIQKGATVPKGFIPRIRLIDPSTCWDIITIPDDITSVIAYQLVFPTQWQTYTKSEVGATGAKFVMQQIPSPQVQHYKVNCYSNEKRGRSDLFPALGYLKRLRDAVNYSVVAMQKSVAWAIDTTIQGSQTDLDAYVTDQQALGTVAPAGSEFVHTAAITRQYLSNNAATGGGQNVAFEWCLNMIAAAVQIPVNYFGTHISGGSTRASALVATEPVAKKFEQRQQDLENILHGMWKRVMEWAGIEADCEVTFPEVIVQDRSQKIKDLKIAEDARYISHERAATIVAKELGISDYEYDSEQEAINDEAEPPIYPNLITPLTSPGSTSGPAAPAGGAPGGKPNGSPPAQKSAVTSQDRKAVADKG